MLRPIIRDCSEPTLRTQLARLKIAHPDLDLGQLYEQIGSCCLAKGAILLYAIKEGSYTTDLLYKIGMDVSVMARIPKPQTAELGSIINSEVATTHFLLQGSNSSGYRIAIPQILEWNDDASSLVGSEYLIMDYPTGTRASTVWCDMDSQQRQKLLRSYLQYFTCTKSHPLLPTHEGCWRTIPTENIRIVGLNDSQPCAMDRCSRAISLISGSSTPPTYQVRGCALTNQILYGSLYCLAGDGSVATLQYCTGPRLGQAALSRRLPSGASTYARKVASSLEESIDCDLTSDVGPWSDVQFLDRALLRTSGLVGLSSDECGKFNVDCETRQTCLAVLKGLVPADSDDPILVPDMDLENIFVNPRCLTEITNIIGLQNSAIEPVRVFYRKAFDFICDVLSLD